MACYETRFIVSFHLSKFRNENFAFTLINDSRKNGYPKTLITARCPVYNEAIAMLLPNTTNIPVDPISNDLSNNLIESFNKTFKAWYKAKKGFNSFEKANNLIFMFIFHYNFIRPHGSLDNNTSAEVVGFATDSLSKNSWFIAA